jgi:outer membrane protein
MKKLFLLFAICFFGTHYAVSQKFGYVDAAYILEQMPEYQEAKKEINTLSLAWQDEIRNKYKEIEAKYDELQAEEVLLTPELKAERMAEIRQMEEEAKQLQDKIFGFEGLFFLKKQELIKPVQDEVFEAVEKVAKNQRLAIVFDKSGELVMIYTDPVHDYTEFVLEELGLLKKTEDTE